MASKQAKAPISAHPLFSAVVAVWFAALFGLGSGVLPNVLFERIITATGLAALIPSATPPLGATFRILISLTAATCGAVLGFMLARRLAASAPANPSSALARLTPKPNPVPRIETKRRPISVNELGDDTKIHPMVESDETGEPISATAPLPGRRRSLAMAEDERRSDFFTDRPLTQADAAPVFEPAAALQEPPMEQPLDLASFTQPAPNAAPAPTSQVAPEAFEGPVHISQLEPRIEDESIVERGLYGLRNRSPFAKPFGDENEEPVDLGPPPFAAPEPEPIQVFQPAEPVAEPAQVFAAAAQAADPILPTDPKADIADLGIVQLTERLGASLRKRLARPAAPPTFIDGLKADFGIETEIAKTPEEIAPGSAIFGQPAFEPVAPDAPPPPPVIPAALRPLPPEIDGFGDDEDEDSHVPSLSLPLGKFSAPALLEAVTEAEEEELEEIGEAEENYSSLLAMNAPFRNPAEFVRIDEPEPEDGEIEPAVVFPGEAAQAEPAPATREARPFDAPSIATPGTHKADPEETDRALRSALATLQRMSGAA